MGVGEENVVIENAPLPPASFPCSTVKTMTLACHSGHNFSCHSSGFRSAHKYGNIMPYAHVAPSYTSYMSQRKKPLLFSY